MRDEKVKSFCEIAGCTDHVVAGRWVVTGNGEQRHVEVCWKHAEGELDPGLLESLTVPPAD
jgi:hypothetical protein